MSFHERKSLLADGERLVRNGFKTVEYGKVRGIGLRCRKHIYLFLRYVNVRQIVVSVLVGIRVGGIVNRSRRSLILHHLGEKHTLKGLRSAAPGKSPVFLKTLAERLENIEFLMAM